jgi:hypothetical protein
MKDSDTQPGLGMINRLEERIMLCGEPSLESGPVPRLGSINDCPVGRNVGIWKANNYGKGKDLPVMDVHFTAFFGGGGK